MGVILYKDFSVSQGIAWPDAVDPAILTWRTGVPDLVTLLPPLVDMTGWGARLMLRATRDAASALILSLTAGAGITLGGALGTIALAISAAQSLPIAQGDYPYDLFLDPPSGASVHFASGFFHIRNTVTR